MWRAQGDTPMFLDYLADLWTVVQSQIVTIPTDNALGVAYVILNLFSVLILTLLGFSGTGTPLFGR